MKRTRDQRDLVLHEFPNTCLGEVTQRLKSGEESGDFRNLALYHDWDLCPLSEAKLYTKFFKAMETNTSLKRLRLSMNLADALVGESPKTFLERNTGLEWLCIGKQTTWTSSYVIEGLQSNTTLRTLILEEVASYTPQRITLNTGLVNLDISFCKLTAASLSLLCSGLARHTTLKTLIIRFEKLKGAGETCIDALNTMFRENRSLRKVHINGSWPQKDQLIDAICSNPVIEDISREILSECGFVTDHLRCNQHMSMFMLPCFHPVIPLNTFFRMPPRALTTVIRSSRDLYGSLIAGTGLPMEVWANILQWVYCVIAPVTKSNLPSTICVEEHIAATHSRLVRKIPGEDAQFYRCKVEFRRFLINGLATRVIEKMVPAPDQDVPFLVHELLFALSREQQRRLVKAAFSSDRTPFQEQLIREFMSRTIEEQEE